MPGGAARRGRSVQAGLADGVAGTVPGLQDVADHEGRRGRRPAGARLLALLLGVGAAAGPDAGAGLAGGAALHPAGRKNAVSVSAAVAVRRVR